MSQKQDGNNDGVIVKTLCPPVYHHNGFVAAYALGNMMYVMYTKDPHCI